MAKATGYTCDLEGCGKFETARSDTAPPDGWITVSPHATVPKTPPDPRRNGGVKETGPAHLHLCSNRCLAELGLQRYEAEAGKRLVRQPKKDERKKVSA